MSGFDPGAGGSLVVTFRTAGDELVCPICAPLNGNTYDADDPALPVPPLHGGCRCHLEYDDSGEPVDADDQADLIGTAGEPSQPGSAGVDAGDWDADLDPLPDDPKDPDNELVDDPAFGVGPWDANTSDVPSKAKGNAFT